MEQHQSLEELKDLLLNAPDSNATRIVAVTISVLLLATVLWMVRRRTLREEYTPIWIAAAFGMALVSLRFDLLRTLTKLVGAWTPSSTILFLGEMFLIGVCLNYAVRLSRYGTQLKNLGQQTAILNAKLDKLQEELEEAVPGPEPMGDPSIPKLPATRNSKIA